MPVIQVLTTGGEDGRVRVIVDGHEILLQNYEVLQFREYEDGTIRFSNKERTADVPDIPSTLSEVSVDGNVPTTTAELTTLLAAVFPTMPATEVGGGGAGLQSATVTLTDVQIKALPTTGVEVVAAPGAGNVIQLISAVGVSDASGGAYTNISGLILLALNNDGYPTLQAAASPLENPFSYIVPFEVYGTIAAVAIEDVTNSPLTIFADSEGGDFTGGNAANTLKVTVYYVVVDL